MNIQINNNDKGWFISCDDERITDFTEVRPKKGTIVKIVCPISSLKSDIENMFLEGIFDFINSPYISDTFVVEDDLSFFMLAVLNKDIQEETNVNQ